MVIILGAGPAGLSAAYHLEKDYLILERAAEPGGLCRSFELGGFTFDLGGHAFFTRLEPVRHLLWKISGNIFTQARSAWVYSHGATVPFPIQANLFGLPADVVKECLLGLIETRGANPSIPPRHLLDWIERSFGPGLARHFMVPYNSKLWAHPLTEVSPGWTGQRIVQPDIGDILDGALKRRDFRAYDNATVSYPAHGGFMGFFSGFLPSVGPHIRQGEVARINLHGHWLETTDGTRYEYDHLVSTIPLTDLVQRTEDASEEVRTAAARLKHNSLYLVNLVFNRPDITDMQRLYAADAEIPWHKLVFNSNSSPTLKRASGFPIQAEVSFSPFKRVDPHGLVDRVVDSLRRIKLINPDDQVICSSVTTLPLAYPVYDAFTADATTVILNEYGNAGVQCAGRFGEWRYINSDAAVLRGLEVAKMLNTSAK